MANKPALARRNERFVFDRLRAAWLRITEDRVVTRYEIVEFGDEVAGACAFAAALASEHAVSQALPRATDPRYVGDLVAAHQRRMAVLPDAA